MTMLNKIKFSTDDGVSNVISVCENDKSDRIILCVPAMGVPAKQYFQLLKELSDCGLSSACFDLRGNGHSSLRASRRSNFGYADLAEVDLPAAIATLKKVYPDKKLVLLGHSLGGQICSLFISQNQGVVEHLILTASCSVYYKNWPSPYRWGLLLFSQAAWLISSIMGYFPGRKLGFGGREAQGTMRDWAYNARTGKYTLANSKYCYEPFTKTKGLRVLAINFADDDLSPVSATDHLLSKLSPNYVIKKLISAAEIGRNNAGHFNWLRSPNYVAKVISEYLDNQDNN